MGRQRGAVGEELGNATVEPQSGKKSVPSPPLGGNRIDTNFFAQKRLHLGNIKQLIQELLHFWLG